MSANEDFSGVTSRDWITIQGPNWLFYLSDGSFAWIIPDDPEHPSGWQVQHVTNAGTTALTAMLPVRAGAMEWFRKWLTTNKLSTIPSPEQAAAPWNNTRDEPGGYAAPKWNHRLSGKV